jgi:hypothetical protein
VSGRLDHWAQWNRSQFLEVAVVSSRVWFLVLVSLLCSGAVAATAKASKPATAGTFGSRDQLRQCLDQDDAIKARTQALAATATATSARMSVNDVDAGKLADMKKALDRSDKAAILAFNQLAVAHNAHVQEVDDDVAKTDAANGVLTADKIAMDQDCGSLTYRPADVDAVNRERKKAVAAAVAAASAP